MRLISCIILTVVTQVYVSLPQPQREAAADLLHSACRGHLRSACCQHFLIFQPRDWQDPQQRLEKLNPDMFDHKDRILSFFRSAFHQQSMVSQHLLS